MNWLFALPPPFDRTSRRRSCCAWRSSRTIPSLVWQLRRYTTVTMRGGIIYKELRMRRRPSGRAGAPISCPRWYCRARSGSGLRRGRPAAVFYCEPTRDHLVCLSQGGAMLSRCRCLWRQSSKGVTMAWRDGRSAGQGDDEKFFGRNYYRHSGEPRGGKHTATCLVMPRYRDRFVSFCLCRCTGSDNEKAGWLSHLNSGLRREKFLPRRI